MRILQALFLALLLGLGGAAQTLDIYFIDVEGGQATLIVTPEKQSMLVDAGWPGFDNRDPKRIAAAVKEAGLDAIDYHVISHYHRDHVGGTEELAKLVPIRTYVDHGDNFETSDAAKELFASYERARKQGKHLPVKAGSKIPLKGADVQVVTAAGEMIQKPVKGAGQKPAFCASAERRADDPTENARSVGFLLNFGKFRFLDLGDLTWNKEIELVCPMNRIGTVDVYLSTHHGMNMSGPQAIVHSLQPRVAIINNGATKGGTPEAFTVIRNSPALEDIWQIHKAVKSGPDKNAPEEMIANLEDQEGHQGHYLKLSAKKDGSFTVYNSRNGKTKTYAAR